MNTTKEMRKREASNRLDILRAQGLMGCVTRKFNKKKSELYYSERCPMGKITMGALYYFNDMGGAKDEWLELVKQFEEKHNATVYHITHEITSFGELLDLFYVSDNQEEWIYDRADLRDFETLAYVINLDAPDCSEFGVINYRVYGGGVVRTA